MLDRRSVMLGLLAASATTPAFAATSVGAVRVDLAPAIREGWGARAGAIRTGLQRSLEMALGPTLRRGAGTTLVVTVETIQLSSYAGNSGSRWGGSSQDTDYFESKATLVGAGSRVLATWPVLSAVAASAAGAWYLPDIDQRRLNGLVAHNAGWIARYVTG